MVWWKTENLKFIAWNTLLLTATNIVMKLYIFIKTLKTTFPFKGSVREK